MSDRIVQKKSRQERVAEAAFVVILDVDDRHRLLKKLWELLVAAPIKWIELQYFKGDRVDFGEF